MNNQYDVSILLSTYNGEMYISELLQSLENQEEVSFQIIIRDDGSEDNTVKIIEDFSSKYGNIHLIKANNLGAKKSFMQLTTLKLDTEYYAYCDQDDIWDKDKLSIALKSLKKFKNQSIPLLYYCETRLVDKEKNVILQSTDYGNPYTLGQLLVKNHVPGCTMVFNRALKDKVVDMPYDSYQYMPYHDHWLYIICRMFNGEVCYDNVPRISYRQHGNNTVGERSLLKIFMESGIFDNNQIRSNRAKELLILFKNQVPNESVLTISKLANYDDTIQARFNLLFCKEIKPITFAEKIAFDIFTILGRI